MTDDPTPQRTESITHGAHAHLRDVLVGRLQEQADHGEGLVDLNLMLIVLLVWLLLSGFKRD